MLNSGGSVDANRTASVAVVVGLARAPGADGVAANKGGRAVDWEEASAGNFGGVGLLLAVAVDTSRNSCRIDDSFREAV